MPRPLIIAGYVLALLAVLIGAALTWHELRTRRNAVGKPVGLTWGELGDVGQLRAKIGAETRVGVGLIILAAVLSTASSIGSLYIVT